MATQYIKPKYTDDPAQQVEMVAIEIAVARGVLRYIERAPDGSFWEDRIAGLYPGCDDVINVPFYVLSAWMHLISDLRLEMDADTWLENQENKGVLWTQAMNRAAHNLINGTWYEVSG